MHCQQGCALTNYCLFSKRRIPSIKLYATPSLQCHSVFLGLHELASCSMSWHPKTLMLTGFSMNGPFWKTQSSQSCEPWIGIGLVSFNMKGSRSSQPTSIPTTVHKACNFEAWHTRSSLDACLRHENSAALNSRQTHWSSTVKWSGTQLNTVKTHVKTMVRFHNSVRVWMGRFRVRPRSIKVKICFFEKTLYRIFLFFILYIIYTNICIEDLK